MGNKRQTLTKIDRPFMVEADEYGCTLYVVRDKEVSRYALTRASVYAGAKRGLYAYRGRYGSGYAVICRDVSHKPHPQYTIEYYTRAVEEG